LAFHVSVISAAERLARREMERKPIAVTNCFKHRANMASFKQSWHQQINFWPPRYAGALIFMRAFAAFVFVRRANQAMAILRIDFLVGGDDQ